MEKYPDTYLLYEYMKKISYTVRIKVTLKDAIDNTLLEAAAQEAISRFPYFSVRVELGADGSYILKHNDNPIPVLPERDKRLVLGSDEVSGHLFALTWRDDTIWFNFAHCLCGGFGAMFWVKTTLYQYMTKKYGAITAPADLKTVGSPVEEAELFYPDANDLPKDEPVSRYTGGNNNAGMDAYLKYILNPFHKDIYYYQIEIPAKDFMAYAKKLDASPNSLLSALMFKTTARYFEPQREKFQKKGQGLSAKISADYRDDIGCPGSYRDFVRFIHVPYDWEMGKESIEKLNTRARGPLILQNQPELSWEWFRNMSKAHEGIDAQPNLKSKKKYAAQHSTYRSDARDTYTISYVGQQDWGGMAEHIRSMYSLSDGNLMLEVNALPDTFCICFQMFSKNQKVIDIFRSVLEETGLHFSISEPMSRYLPEIKLPK